MKDWREKLSLRMPAIALLAVTFGFWVLYDRYEPAGPAVLESPSLRDGTKMRGEISENEGRFMLRVPDAGKPARIYFPLPSAVMDHEWIRIRARIRVEGVVTGRHPWNCARLLFTQYRADGRWIPGRHALVTEGGSKEWARHETVFKIAPEAVRGTVLLEQIGTAGSAWFDQIRVQPVRLRASFMWWRILFAVSWLLMGVLYFRRCRLHRRKLRVLIVLNAAAILAGTLMPGIWITDSAERMEAAIRESLPSRTEEAAKTPAAADRTVPKKTSPEKQMDWFTGVEIEAHQAGHFTLFAALCFLVYLSAALERQHPVYFFKVGFDVLLFAAVTESLQFLTLDRSAGVGDLRIDIYGMVSALLLFVAVLPVIRYGRDKSA